MSDLVTIAEFDLLADACLARTMLESAGLYCFLANENLVGVHPVYTSCVGGVQLRVREEDLEDALAVLRGSEAPPDLQNSPDSEDVLTCPLCRSADIERAGNSLFGNALALMSFSLLVAPIPYWGKRNRCKHCGHKWKL
jgi:hypothetical protein